MPLFEELQQILATQDDRSLIAYWVSHWGRWQVGLEEAHLPQGRRTSITYLLLCPLSTTPLLCQRQMEHSSPLRVLLSTHSLFGAEPGHPVEANTSGVNPKQALCVAYRDTHPPSITPEYHICSSSHS